MKRLILLIAMSLVAGSCSLTAPHPVVVGAIYPTGGTQGPGGIEEYRGVTLAAALINERGGVRGRPISLRLEAVERAEQVMRATENLGQSGIDLWIGSYGSTISRPLALAAHRSKSLFWETGAVGLLDMSTAPGDTVFRFPATGAQLGRAAVEFVRSHYPPLLGKDKLRYTVVYVDDVYGRSVGLGAQQTIVDSGLNLAESIPYRLPGTDFGQVAGRIANARTDVLVVSAYLEDAVEMRRELVKQNVPLLAAIGTSSSYCHLEFGKRLGTDAVGLLASDKPDGDILKTETLTEEAASALVWGRDEYEKRYGAPMTGAALSGFSGALALFGNVIPAAEGVTALDVAEAARRIRLPKGSLPNGSGLEFAADGSDNLRATSVIWQWVRPGVRAIVWPPEFATEPVLEVGGE